MTRLSTHADFEPRPSGATLRRLFGYLRPYRGRWALALVIFIACVFLINLYPYVDRILIDDFIAKGRRDGLEGMLLIALVIHVLNHIGFGLRNILIGRTNQAILYDLRVQLFTHLQRLSISFFERVPVGSIMTRFISDLTTLNDFLAWQLALLIHDVALGVFCVLMMFLIDARLAMVALATLPELVGLALVLRPRIRDGYEALREAGSRLNVFLAENISGMRVIQAYVRQNVNLQEF